MQGYYLIGTKFISYIDVSKSKEIPGLAVNYKTCIYDKGLKTLEVNDINPHPMCHIYGKVFLYLTWSAPYHH